MKGRITMSKVTMVARIGTIENGTKSPKVTDVAYVIADHEKMKLTQISKKDIAELIRPRRIECTNLSVTKDGEITFCNGVKDRYTIIDANSNKPIKVASTIIARLEKKGVLVGYAVSNGIARKVSNVSVAEAVTMQKKGEISNGKIRNTSNGDIVSSIEGEYEVIELSFIKAVVKKAEEKIMAEGLKGFEVGIGSISTLITKSGKPMRYAYIVVIDKGGKRNAVMDDLKSALELDNLGLVFTACHISSELTESLKIERAVNPNTFCGAFTLDMLKKLLDRGAKISTGIFDETALIGMTIASTGDIIEGSGSFIFGNEGAVLDVDNFKSVTGMTIDEAIDSIDKESRRLRAIKEEPANEAVAESYDALKLLIDKCIK